MENAMEEACNSMVRRNFIIRFDGFQNFLRAMPTIGLEDWRRAARRSWQSLLQSAVAVLITGTGSAGEKRSNHKVKVLGRRKPGDGGAGAGHCHSRKQSPQAFTGVEANRCRWGGGAKKFSRRMWERRGPRYRAGSMWSLWLGKEKHRQSDADARRGKKKKKAGGSAERCRAHYSVAAA